MGSEERKALVNSFVLLNYNYCKHSLVWMPTSGKLFRKVDTIQKRALCFMINNYKITYKDLLRNTETKYETKEN